MKKIALALVLSSMLAGSALAATQNIAVSASVVGTCQFASAVNVAFGALDQTSTLDAVAPTPGSLEFWCTKNTNYTLTTADATAGIHTGTMTGPVGGSIAYTLTFDNFSGAGNGKTGTIISGISGSILNSNYVDQPAGAYSENVLFTVTPL